MNITVKNNAFGKTCINNNLDSKTVSTYIEKVTDKTINEFANIVVDCERIIQNCKELGQDPTNNISFSITLSSALEYYDLLKDVVFLSSDSDLESEFIEYSTRLFNFPIKYFIADPTQPLGLRAKYNEKK